MPNNELKLKQAREVYLNKTIKIIQLEDPVDRYNGKTGVVERVELDPWNDIRLDGTWGGIGIYPHVDKIEVLK